MILDRFYPIFEDVDWIARMAPLGIKLAQLRIKNRSAEETGSHIAKARDICRVHGVVLVVNDYWREAIDLGCAWVHLGQEDLDSADVPALRKAGIKLGISTHDHAELARAMALKPDYVALGPVYPTILKKMKWQEQGVEQLREWRKLVGATPLVGIGGMTIARAPDVFAGGADIVSVVTDITLNSDPEFKVRQWLAATRSFERNHR